MAKLDRQLRDSGALHFEQIRPLGKRERSVAAWEYRMGTVRREIAPLGGALFQFELFNQSGRDPFWELRGRILNAERFSHATRRSGDWQFSAAEIRGNLASERAPLIGADER